MAENTYYDSNEKLYHNLLEKSLSDMFTMQTGSYWSPNKLIFIINGIHIPAEIILILMFAVAIGFSRILISKIIVQKIIKQRNSLNFTKNKQTQVKLEESVYKFLYYATVWTWGLAISLPKDWLYDTTLYWKNMPHYFGFSQYLYYACETGFYVYSLFAVNFLDVKRDDWTILIIHHIAALLLLGYSWHWGFQRIGTVVLVLLDCSDVFLEITKIMGYLSGRFYDAAKFFFAILLLSWMITRVTLFPLRVCWTSLFEAVPLLKPQGLIWHPIEYYNFNGLLLLVYILQVYWCFRLFRIAYKSTRGKLLDDREEDKEEDGVENKREEQQDEDKKIR